MLYRELQAHIDELAAQGKRVCDVAQSIHVLSPHAGIRYVTLPGHPNGVVGPRKVEVWVWNQSGEVDCTLRGIDDTTGKFFGYTPLEGGA